MVTLCVQKNYENNIIRIYHSKYYPDECLPEVILNLPDLYYNNYNGNLSFYPQEDYKLYLYMT